MAEVHTQVKQTNCNIYSQSPLGFPWVIFFILSQKSGISLPYSNHILPNYVWILMKLVQYDYFIHYNTSKVRTKTFSPSASITSVLIGARPNRLHLSCTGLRTISTFSSASSSHFFRQKSLRRNSAIPVAPLMLSAHRYPAFCPALRNAVPSVRVR